MFSKKLLYTYFEVFTKRIEEQSLSFSLSLSLFFSIVSLSQYLCYDWTKFARLLRQIEYYLYNDFSTSRMTRLWYVYYQSLYYA